MADETRSSGPLQKTLIRLDAQVGRFSRGRSCREPATGVPVDVSGEGVGQRVLGRHRAALSAK
jgi:hypothetical protein